MATLFGMFPFLKTLFADSGYQGPKFAKALAKGRRISTLKSSSAPIRSADLWSCPNACCVAQPMPPLVQRLGVPQPKGLGVLAPCINPPHAQKTLQSGLKSPDGLLRRSKVGQPKLGNETNRTLRTQGYRHYKSHAEQADDGRDGLAQHPHERFPMRGSCGRAVRASLRGCNLASFPCRLQSYEAARGPSAPQSSWSAAGVPLQADVVAVGASTRCTTDVPTPTVRPILRIPIPSARSSRIRCSTDALTGRRPSLVPRSLARARPALTRSRIMPRSNSAKTPHIWNIARPDGVLVSSACWCRYRWQPNACSSVKKPTRS